MGKADGKEWTGRCRLPTRPKPLKIREAKGPEVGRHAGASSGVGWEILGGRGGGAENATARHWTPPVARRAAILGASRRMYAAVCGLRY